MAGAIFLAKTKVYSVQPLCPEVALTDSLGHGQGELLSSPTLSSSLLSLAQTKIATSAKVTMSGDVFATLAPDATLSIGAANVESRGGDGPKNPDSAL